MNAAYGNGLAYGNGMLMLTNGGGFARGDQQAQMGMGSPMAQMGPQIAMGMAMGMNRGMNGGINEGINGGMNGGGMNGY